jgi:hypothetical protein
MFYRSPSASGTARGTQRSRYNTTPAVILSSAVIGASALVLAGCSSAASSGNSGVTSGGRPAAAPFTSSGECAEAEASVKNVGLETAPYMNVRTKQDLANAAAEIASSAVAHDDTAEILAPVQAALTSVGKNSNLDTALSSILLDYNAFSNIIVTAGAPGGASTVQVASDARGIVNNINSIKKICG